MVGRLGAVRAWTVHGQGLDVLTTTGPTEIAEWRDGTVRRFAVSAAEAGLPEASMTDLMGGDGPHNARVLTALLDGAAGPYRDIVLLNAAAAVVVSDRADDLAQGAALAAAAIDEGRARAALDALVRITNEEEAAA